MKETVYAFLLQSDMKLLIDLRTEAITTMLYHLESDYYDETGPLLIYHGSFYQNAHIWFYSTISDEIKEKSEFLKIALESSY